MKALIVLFLLLIPVASAHTLKIDGTIGVTLHVEPNDEPVAGEESLFLVTVRDTAGKFNPENCDCMLSIHKDGVEIDAFPFVQTGVALPVNYVFFESGTYDIIVTGTPHDGSFDKFTAEFQYYVTAPFANAEGENPLRGYFPYIVLVAGIFIILLAIPRRKHG